MGLRRVAGTVLTGLLLLAVVAMMAGQLAGQPVLLSYVETGSMEPTMEPGDGFIAIPPFLAGPPEVGDVITFEAKNLQGGGLTTHRVVGETEGGYITKGDANPTTDQSGPEPPVTRDRVKATALEIGDSVVVIPKIGLLALGVQGLLSGVQQFLASTFGTRAFLGPTGLAYLFAAFGVLVYVGSALFENTSERSARRNASRETETVSGSAVVVGLTVVLVVLLTASMVVPSGTQTFEFVSSDVDAEGPSVIGKGETEKVQYRVPSNGFIPTVVFLEPASDRLTVSPSEVYVGSGEVRTVIVEITAPPRTGSYAAYMTEHRYLAVLPQSTIRGLYRVHPWAPILAIDAMFAIGFASLSMALIGTGPMRISSRTGGA
jgi:signal peptidase